MSPRTDTSVRRTRPRPVDGGLRSTLLVPVVVAVLAVAGAVWAVTGATGEERSPVAEVRTDADSDSGSGGGLAALARRDADDPMAMGEADAPVVMIMWSDFQCPFCGRFARETEPELIDRYVSDGTLRLEWRDFPYLGEQSQLAAQAGRAAGAQGAFWEFHDLVYGLELPPQSGELTSDRLVDIAEELGLDTDRFAQDMQSQEVIDAVAADFGEGQALGITGTPAFLVGDTPIMGAQPLETFTAAIEAAAAGE